MVSIYDPIGPRDDKGSAQGISERRRTSADRTKYCDTTLGGTSDQAGENDAVERRIGGKVSYTTRVKEDTIAYFRLLIARSTSRPASRALIDSRRSYCFLPFAKANSTFAWPRLEK